MTDTTPTPADRPADLLRDCLTDAVVETMQPRYGGPQHNTPGGLSLTATAEEIRLHRARPIVEAVLTALPAPALAVARQLLGTTEGEDDDESCGRFVPDTPRAPGLCASCGDAKGWHSLLATTEPAAAPPAPADRAAARDRIRRAICEASGFTWLPDELMEPDEYGEHADAVLAVLAADAAAGVQPPTTTEAHPPSVEYIAEVLEDDGVWMYLGADPDPAVAARRRASVTRRHPEAETRTVRKTTTYTVEPEPAAPAAPEEPTWVGATELASDREIARVAATGVVGYRQNQGRLLHCLAHKPAPASRYADFHEVGADDLDDGGICVHPDCGRDLLAAWPTTRAPEEPTR
ncbi:hypothetical protein [Streptomyces bacillaris]|uniref:hypothetical protein n=1 Tax=Streptomyces bacillaris TaxID=68179 RepID=UPI003EBCA427